MIRDGEEMLDTPVFQFGEEVYVPDAKTGDKNRRWFICGMRMRFGYRFGGIEYEAVQGTYGDYSFNTLFGRCDANVVSGLRVEQIMTQQQWLFKQRQDLESLMKTKEQELKDIQKRLAEASDSKGQQ